MTFVLKYCYQRKAEHKVLCIVKKVHLHPAFLHVIRKHLLTESDCINFLCKIVTVSLSLSLFNPLKELLQFTVFKFSLLQKIHRQRVTVPGLWKRMPQTHLFGSFRLPSGLHFSFLFHIVEKGVSFNGWQHAALMVYTKIVQELQQS